MTPRNPKPHLTNRDPAKMLAHHFHSRKKNGGGSPVCPSCGFHDDPSDSKIVSGRVEKRWKVPTAAACWCVRSINACVNASSSRPFRTEFCMCFTVELQGWERQSLLFCVCF
uniref:Uncharacterized protein n=1 Tax=Micrurus lemniscatus lemniscatus TaxID=129467 RepID=A0A2D4IH98_MICLE